MRLAITGSHGVGKTSLIKKIEEEVMKIGVTGSHGTGKTTLSKFFSGKKGFKFLPEAPVQAMQVGFELNEATSIECELWIIAKQLEMELRWQDNWVADKCMIDLLAYAYYLFPNDLALLDVIERVAVKSFKNYDLVVYLPCGEFPIEDDGIRSTDPRFQSDIDKTIVDIMERNDIVYHRLTGTVQERFDALVKLIS